MGRILTEWALVLHCRGMEKPEEGDPVEAKALADRAKFESITKVTTKPLITKGSRGRRTLNVPDLKSPDEHNPKWVVDPEDIIAARKAARKAKRDPNSQA